MYGTLLGAVRDNDIIPYDWDFDIGAYVHDYKKILALNKDISKYGYILKKKYTSAFNINRQKRVCHKSDTQCDLVPTDIKWKVSIKILYFGKAVGDIYLYTNCKDKMLRRCDLKSGIYFWPKGTVPSWYTNRLSHYKIRNKIFPGPRKADILLNYWYGKTWKIPIKAKAQGGVGDKNSDYYGGAKRVNLQKLCKYTEKLTGHRLNPKLPSSITHIYPHGHIKWVYRYEKN